MGRRRCGRRALQQYEPLRKLATKKYSRNSYLILPTVLISEISRFFLHYETRHTISSPSLIFTVHSLLARLLAVEEWRVGDDVILNVRAWQSGWQWRVRRLVGRETVAHFLLFSVTWESYWWERYERSARLKAARTGSALL